MARAFFPVLVFLAVLSLAALLLVGMIVRPWELMPAAGVSVTSGNGNQERSKPSYVGQEGPVDWRHDMTPAEPMADSGQGNFIAYGCASCHGIDGMGTRWAPMNISKPEQVKVMVRVGPGGMPAYSEQYLPDDTIGQMASWLMEQMAKKPEIMPPATTTPPPTTPAPTGLPSTTVPPSTTTPPQSGDAARGQAAYGSTGCAACHGKTGKGTSFSPALDTPEFAQKYPADAGIADVIRKGKGIMGGYDQGAVSDAALADIIAYIRSLKQ